VDELDIKGGEYATSRAQWAKRRVMACDLVFGEFIPICDLPIEPFQIHRHPYWWELVKRSFTIS